MAAQLNARESRYAIHSYSLHKLVVLELGMHIAACRPRRAGPDGESRSSDSWCIILVVFPIGAAIVCSLGIEGVAGRAVSLSRILGGPTMSCVSF